VKRLSPAETDEGGERMEDAARPPRTPKDAPRAPAGSPPDPRRWEGVVTNGPPPCMNRLGSQHPAWGIWLRGGLYLVCHPKC